MNFQKLARKINKILTYFIQLVSEINKKWEKVCRKETPFVKS